MQDQGGSLAAFSTLFAIAWAWKIHKSEMSAQEKKHTELLEREDNDKKVLQQALIIYVADELARIRAILDSFVPTGEKLKIISPKELDVLKNEIEIHFPIELGNILGNPEHVLKIPEHYLNDTVKIIKCIDMCNKSASLLLTAKFERWGEHSEKLLTSLLAQMKYIDKILNGIQNNF